MVESGPPSEPVSTIMSTRVVSVKATEKVSKVLQKMVRHKIGSIIVFEKGRPAGILTERDISKRVARGQNVRGVVAGNIMSRPLVTVTSATEVLHAVEQMVRKDIRRLPVIEGDKVVGMVTERDIFRWVIMVAYSPNIPEDLRKLIETRAQAQALAQ